MEIKQIFTISENENIEKNVYKMVLLGNTTAFTRAGQFVNISLQGKYLRRPISVCHKDENSLTLIYKVVGEGTEQMSKMQNGDKLDILVALGNGFDTDIDCQNPLLIGGGVGVPPLYDVALNFINKGITPTVILGFNNKEEIFYEDEFKKLGANVYVSTVNGEYGTKGFVTDCIKNKNIAYDYYFACGPEPMLKAIHSTCSTKGQLSFEERMGCGFGACMGCSCKTKYGNKRICKDGPILTSEEVIW